MKRTHYIIWLGTFNRFKPEKKEYLLAFEQGKPFATYEPLNAQRFSKPEYAERFMSDHNLAGASVEPVEIVH